MAVKENWKMKILRRHKTFDLLQDLISLGIPLETGQKNMVSTHPLKQVTGHPTGALGYTSSVFTSPDMILRKYSLENIHPLIFPMLLLSC